MLEAMQALRDGLLGSPAAEDVTFETGGRRETIRGVFLEPVEPVTSVGGGSLSRLDPQVRVSYDDLVVIGAGPNDFVLRGASEFDPGIRYTVVLVSPPDVAGMTHVTLRKYAQ